MNITEKAYILARDIILGKYDALTDSQEIKDVAKAIENFTNQILSELQQENKRLEEDRLEMKELIIVCSECETEIQTIFDYEQCDGWDVCPECGAIESTKEIYAEVQDSH